MAKYKVIKAFYKLSEAKNYSKGDEIELSSNEAEKLTKHGYLAEEKEPYSKSKDGTKGIVYKKTIEEADKEIKELNSKK